MASIKTEFSMNKIAEALGKASVEETYPIAEFGGREGMAIREGLVKECGGENAERCFVDEQGVAEFVGRRIGKGWANRTGDYYHLGEVRGRTLYYGTNPSRRFYVSHKTDDVGIVLGSNVADVPDSWGGHAVYFSELFYVNEPTGEIKLSPNIARNVVPAAKRRETSSGARAIHQRRSHWLMFLAHLFSKPFNAKDFFHGRLRPQVACDWFKKHHPGVAPTSTKQYQRDLREFRCFDGKGRQLDKREKFVVLLLRVASDPKFTTKERLGVAKVIPELVTRLDEAADKIPNRPVEITPGVWQRCKDGTKEYVAVTPVEDFFKKLGKRLGEDAE